MKYRILRQVGVLCLSLGVVFHAQGVVQAQKSTKELQAIPYREADAQGTIWLEMVPPRGGLDGEGVAVEAATGKRLWRVRVYSPAVRCYAGGHLVLANASDHGKDKAGEAWAILFFDEGREIKRYTFDDLATAAKVKVSELLAKNALPLSWAARLETPVREEKTVRLALSVGQLLAFDAETGKLQSVSATQRKPDDLKPDSVLAPGYRRALRARTAAVHLNAFAVQAHNEAAKSAVGENTIGSPYGIASALSILERLATKESGKKITELLVKGGITKEDTARVYEDLHDVVMGPPWSLAWLGVQLEESKKDKPLRVKRVLPGSPLQEYVKAGDQLLEVNGKGISTPAELWDRIKQSAEAPLELTTRSGTTIHHLHVPFGKGLPSVLLKSTVWVRQGSPWQSRFVKELQGLRGAEVELLDTTDANKAAARINARLAVLTGQKAVKVVAAEDLSRENLFLLTNAVSFSGPWALPFEEANTDLKGKFHVTSDKTVQTPVMRRQMRLGCWKDPKGKYTAVELPYRGRQYGFVLVLPDAVDGLRGVEETLAKEGVEHVCAHLDASLEEVSLHLPRFHTRRISSWEKVLADLGLPTAFQIKSGSEKKDKGDISVSVKDIRQEAVIRVHEEGTQAGAATTIVIGVVGIPAKPIVVQATHPFLFLLRDRSSNAVLFTGRIVNPAAE